MIKILSNDRVIIQPIDILQPAVELTRFPIRNTSQIADITIHQTISEHIKVFDIDIHAHISDTIILVSQSPGCYFLLSRKNTFTKRLINHPLYERSCNLIHVDELRIDIVLKAQQQFSGLLIYFPLSVLQNLQPDTIFTDFIASVQKDGIAKLFTFNIPASTKLLITIQEIEHCSTLLELENTARSLLNNLVELAQIKHKTKKITQKQADKLYTLTQLIHIYITHQLTHTGKQQKTDINLTKKLTATKIRQQAGVSEHLIKKFFTTLYTYTLHDYINEQRIITTISLLRTNDKLENIAKQAGFTNVNTFKRLFQKFCGIPPSAYRYNKKG